MSLGVHISITSIESIASSKCIRLGDIGNDETNQNRKSPHAKILRKISRI